MTEQDAMGPEDERLTWRQQMFEAHPEILKMAEETRVLEGLKGKWQNKSATDFALGSFTRFYSEVKVFNPDVLPEEALILLISEYLREQKMTEARSSLIKEVLEKHPEYARTLLSSDSEKFGNYIYDHTFENVFEGILKLGISDIDNLFTAPQITDDDFPKLPAEEYDQHIVFKSNDKEYKPVLDETISLNSNCEMMSETYDGKTTTLPSIMTVNQLILYLLERNDRFNTKLFTVYKLFMSSSEMFQKVLELEKKDHEQFVEILKLWADMYPNDFSTSMINSISELKIAELEDVVTVLNTHKPRTNFEKFNIVLKGHESMKEFYPMPSLNSRFKLEPEKVFQLHLKLSDFGPELIAEAMYVMDLEMYKSIGDDELVMGEGPHIEQVLKMYELATNWIKQCLFKECLFPDKDKIGILKVKEIFMEVYLHLYRKNDFHSMAIINSVFSTMEMKDFAPHLTKLKLGLKDVVSLPLLFNGNDGFNFYWKAIEKCEVNAEVPFIPFIGILLHNVFTIQSGLDTFIDDKVNFLKLNTIYNTVERFNEYKKRNNTLQVVDQVISLILQGMSSQA